MQFTRHFQAPIFFFSLLLLPFLPMRAAAQTRDWPDIRSVPEDLEIPPLAEGIPAAGTRVRQTISGRESARVYHVLNLPSDWVRGQNLPVIVEFAGNGGYRSAFGDECSGRPEDCCLGYGLTEGRGCLWLCLPFLNGAGDDLALTWWGDAPTYDPQPSLRYCRAAVDEVCHKYGGDRDRVVLTGFSRGAIACNAIGLYDDETAGLWAAFIPCSHYDGVRRWPFPGSDPDAAAVRLERLKRRPQFICGEADQTDQTRQYLKPHLTESRLTFATTGFRNHSDRWILRPSPARTELRDWLQKVLTTKSKPQD